MNNIQSNRLKGKLKICRSSIKQLETTYSNILSLMYPNPNKIVNEDFIRFSTELVEPLETLFSVFEKQRLLLISKMENDPMVRQIMRVAKYSRAFAEVCDKKLKLYSKFNSRNPHSDQNKRASNYVENKQLVDKIVDKIKLVTDGGYSYDFCKSDILVLYATNPYTLYVLKKVSGVHLAAVSSDSESDSMWGSLWSSTSNFFEYVNGTQAVREIARKLLIDCEEFSSKVRKDELQLEQKEVEQLEDDLTDNLLKESDGLNSSDEQELLDLQAQMDLEEQASSAPERQILKRNNDDDDDSNSSDERELLELQKQMELEERISSDQVEPGNSRRNNDDDDEDEGRGNSHHPGSR